MYVFKVEHNSIEISRFVWLLLFYRTLFWGTMLSLLPKCQCASHWKCMSIHSHSLQVLETFWKTMPCCWLVFSSADSKMYQNFCKYAFWKICGRHWAHFH